MTDVGFLGIGLGYAGRQQRLHFQEVGFFAAPADPNGASADIGFALVWEIMLDAGASLSITSLHCYGDSATDARDCATRASMVPEPATAALSGLGLIGLGLARRGYRR